MRSTKNRRQAWPVGEDGDELFLDHGTSVAFYDPSTLREVQRLGEGSLSEAGAMALAERGGASHDAQTLYVLEPARGRVAMFVPEAPGAPAVESEGTARSATARRCSSRRSTPGGYQASYSFRFSTGALPPPQASCSPSATPACYETPVEPLGGGFADRQAQQPVSGLPPSTSYHYAVLVHSALLSEGAPTLVQGPERTFTTQTAAFAGGLLDGREWSSFPTRQERRQRLPADVLRHDGSGRRIGPADHLRRLRGDPEQRRR